MTAQRDLDRTLERWFGEEAAPPPPPEPLARILDATRGRRPRPSLVAHVGSHWVTGVPGTAFGMTTSLRSGLVVALVALLVLAFAGGALLVGSRFLAPPLPPGRTYLNQVVSLPDLSLPMARPTLVPLLDGRVLVIGDDGDGGGTGTRALVYDPATGGSERAGPLVGSDTLAVDSAVRLEDGTVLVLGTGGRPGDTTYPQVFDPGTMQFTAVGPMVTPRTWAGATLLHDGRVLIAGGYPSGQDAATSSAELFDPVTRTFSSTGSMGMTRSMPSLAVLPDGRVFVSPGESRTTAEVYDPESGTFSAAGTMSDTWYGDAFALPDGRVVVIGGRSLGLHGAAQVWDPSTRTFAPERTLRGWVTTEVLLDDGRILLVGGEPSNWSGLFDPTTGAQDLVQPVGSWHPKAIRLADGRVLIVGGRLDGNLRTEGGGSSAPGVPTVQLFQ